MREVIHLVGGRNVFFWSLLAGWLLVLFVLIAMWMYPGEWALTASLGMPLVEMASFFFLAFLSCIVFQLRAAGLALVLALLISLAAVFEMAQIWSPFREAKLVDMMANFASVALGVMCGVVGARFTERLTAGRKPQE